MWLLSRGADPNRRDRWLLAVRVPPQAAEADPQAGADPQSQARARELAATFGTDAQRAQMRAQAQQEMLVRIFADLGVQKLRLTGGEPLLRHDLPTLVSLLRSHKSITDLALTTNGILLARHAGELKAALYKSAVM